MKLKWAFLARNHVIGVVDLETIPR